MYRLLVSLLDYEIDYVFFVCKDCVETLKFCGVESCEEISFNISEANLVKRGISYIKHGYV